ncbi:BTB/POZ and MATH domain-containing protein 2-like [Phragmites australis]|uniref:BTB/POZ and MATH domain-containing protein 2-like n=1 Tax=Phragmites australis TaxID=29695 RepID=UPI002D788E50|nr:BTB/POZ and MATH domain-containing protein 2-like [Phragmites australis]
MANASASSVGQPLPEASSRCLAQGSTAAHNFEVTNFSLLDGMGVGKSVSSSTFSVGGFAWCINFYPDGADSGDKAAHVSAFLNFKGGGADARVKFSLSVLGKGGQVARLLSTAQTFKPAHARWGWKNLMQKSDLQPLLRLNNDRFTIRCVLTVIKGPQVEDVRAIVVPHSSLLQDFASLLKDGEGADVEFSVGGRLFPAHRCVLAARSAVFRAELLGAMKEKDAWCIQIDDMEPSVFEALLHFIYSDSLPEDWDADKNVPMQHLLVAADRYGLDRLRLMCEGKMSRSIDAETVATTLALAEQHHCVQLKRACLEFIASGGVLGTVMGTDGFVHLGVSCPLVLLEILDKLASLRI